MVADDDISRGFSHYFTIMIFTILSAISGMRFLHTLFMGVLTLVFGIVSVGILGVL